MQVPPNVPAEFKSWLDRFAHGSRAVFMRNGDVPWTNDDALQFLYEVWQFGIRSQPLAEVIPFKKK